MLPAGQTTLAKCLNAGYPDSGVRCADLLWESFSRLTLQSWGRSRRGEQPPRRARPRNSLPRCA